VSDFQQQNNSGHQTVVQVHQGQETNAVVVAAVVAVAVAVAAAANINSRLKGAVDRELGGNLYKKISRF
jgi:hypothetical protein